MTEPSREQLLAEGRKQSRIYGVDMKCAEIYAAGWAAAARTHAEYAAIHAAKELVAAHRRILEAREVNKRQIAEHQAKWLRMLKAPGGLSFEEQRDRHLLQSHLAKLHGRSEAFDFMLNARYPDAILAALDGDEEQP